MIQCKRLGYAVLTSRDPAGQIPYFTNMLGLVQSHAGDDRVVFATQKGVETIAVVRSDAAPGLAALGFQISPNLPLEKAQADLARAGIVADIRAGATPTAPRVLALTDPKGTTIELYNELAFADVNGDGRGVSPLKIGHVAYNVPDAAGMSDFYMKHLGFKKADWMGNRLIFLRCTTDHHTVNFFEGEEKLHHIAFEVKDFPELVRSADYLTQKGFSFDWGPARHTIGHNCACYHINPDGIRVEFYAEMDQMLDEDLGYYEPKPWHEDRPQVPKDWDNGPAPLNQWVPAAGQTGAPRRSAG